MTVLVIGGGAAGLAAAVTAARAGAAVSVADRMERVGKKLLATGNGRCNLSSTAVEAHNYHGAGAARAFSIIESAGADFVSKFFRGLGVLTAREGGSRLYPRTFLANTVLDVLRAECARLGVTELCGYEAVAIRRRSGALETAFRPRGAVTADRVIVAAGGMAAPRLGSDGSGYALLTALGHELAAPLPALAQLNLARGGIRGLKGVRLRAAISLWLPGRAVCGGPVKGAAAATADGWAYREEGELLFSDFGVSGIPALNMSNRLAPYLNAQQCQKITAPHGQKGVAPLGQKGAAPQRHMGGASRADGGVGGQAYTLPAGFVLSVDLLPEYTLDQIREMLKAQARRRSAAAPAELLTGFLHRRVAALVAEAALAGNGSGDTAAPPNGAATLHRLAAAVKDWRHPLTGVMGFDTAQVTYGGISLDGFSPDTLESKLVPGVYAAGEILDVTGDCGGYNLHWVWVSGCLAGCAAAGERRVY